MLCYDSASFTKRVCENKVNFEFKNIELIGSDEIYKPVCRESFYKETKEPEQQENPI